MTDIEEAILWPRLPGNAPPGVRREAGVSWSERVGLTQPKLRREHVALIPRAEGLRAPACPAPTLPSTLTPRSRRSQSFHPTNPKNLAKLFEAEEKQKKEAKKKEELAKMYEQEAMRRETKELLQGGASASDPAPSLSFMYALPPGLAEAQAKKKPVPTEEQTRAERDAERFPLLANAPTRGEYTTDIPVNHKPFGVELKKTKCSRCGAWGHANGDRECPMRNMNPLDDGRKAAEDPMSRLAGAESSGAALRWAPKANPEEGRRGVGAASDANQQFVVADDDEAAAAAAAAAQLALGGGEIEPELLAMLSERQRRKLLKMYAHELAGGSEAGDGARDKERKHHRKKEKKSKKSKKGHREKKHASKKEKKRRRSDSDSDSDSDSGGS